MAECQHDGTERLWTHLIARDINLLPGRKTSVVNVKSSSSVASFKNELEIVFRLEYTVNN